jgi:hypothetical protein
MYLRALLAVKMNKIGRRGRTGLQAKGALHSSIHGLDSEAGTIAERPHPVKAGRATSRTEGAKREIGVRRNGPGTMG